MATCFRLRPSDRRSCPKFAVSWICWTGDLVSDASPILFHSMVTRITGDPGDLCLVPPRDFNVAIAASLFPDLVIEHRLRSEMLSLACFVEALLFRCHPFCPLFLPRCHYSNLEIMN